VQFSDGIFTYLRLVTGAFKYRTTCERYPIPFSLNSINRKNMIYKRNKNFAIDNDYVNKLIM